MPWGSGKRENEAGRFTARKCSGIPCLWQFMDSAALILQPSKWMNNSCRGLTLRTTLQRRCFTKTCEFFTKMSITVNLNFKLIRLSCTGSQKSSVTHWHCFLFPRLFSSTLGWNLSYKTQPSCSFQTHFSVVSTFLFSLNCSASPKTVEDCFLSIFATCHPC